jgi:hypothetical protein
MEKHFNLRKQWEFPEGFPQFEIIEAYKNPQVNEDKTEFYPKPTKK